MTTEFGRCKDCKFWTPPVLDEYGECEGIPDGDENDLAYTWDFESYSSGLKTKAEFGCVLFEQKASE